MCLWREQPPFSVIAFSGKSKAADRCERTGAPQARKPNERSECRRLRLNKKTTSRAPLPVKRSKPIPNAPLDHRADVFGMRTLLAFNRILAIGDRRIFRRDIVMAKGRQGIDQGVASRIMEESDRLAA